MSNGYTNGNQELNGDGESLTNSSRSSSIDNGAFQDATNATTAARKANQQAQRASNIFGDCVDDGATPSKSGKAFVKSSIFGGETAEEAATPRRANKAMGNPITGEGYNNGNSDSQRAENGPNTHKGRQPPGGHSSRLW